MPPRREPPPVLLRLAVVAGLLLVVVIAFVLALQGHLVSGLGPFLAVAVAPLAASYWGGRAGKPDRVTIPLALGGLLMGLLAGAAGAGAFSDPVTATVLLTATAYLLLCVVLGVRWFRAARASPPEAAPA